jgi:hypothetical protein
VGVWWRSFALLVAGFATGCTSHVTVQARAARSQLSPAPRAASIALRIAPDIAATRATVPIGSEDPADYSVTFDLGAALVDTIATAAAEEFATVRRTDSQACPANGTPVITVALAAPPSLQTRWVEVQRGVGGGTAAEFALRLDAPPCAGRPPRARVVTGFGAADSFSRLANRPGEEDFRLGVEAALTDLANQLRVAFRDLAPAD